MADFKLQRPSDLARDLGVSADWIRREAAAGRIPHIKAGDTILLNRKAVEAALLGDVADREGVQDRV